MDVNAFTEHIYCILKDIDIKTTGKYYHMKKLLIRQIMYTQQFVACSQPEMNQPP